MPIGKVVEISAQSERSFDDAIERGIEWASGRFEDVTGAWIKEQKVEIEDGEIQHYNVKMQVTVLIEDEEEEEEAYDEEREESRKKRRRR